MRAFLEAPSGPPHCCGSAARIKFVHVLSIINTQMSTISKPQTKPTNIIIYNHFQSISPSHLTPRGEISVADLSSFCIVVVDSKPQSPAQLPRRFIVRTMTRNLLRPKNALLTVCVLLMAALLVQPAHAWGSRDAKFELKLSQNANRSEAISLDGTGTRLDSEIAVFLETSLDPRYVRSVTFYVEGDFYNRESRSPFDLGSTQRNGLANLVVTEDAFDVGPQKIKAVVQRWFAYPKVVEATLNVLPAEPTIVEIAAGNPDFSILVEALVAADLVEAVNGPGPISVFAPTNDAFIALLEALGISKDELFADKELLTKVLTYHVLPNALFAEAVLVNEQLIPVQGEPIEVDADNAKVNDSNLIAVDIAASNGVIHVIDAVLLPPSILDPKPTIAEIAAGNPDFSILVEAAVETGLVGLLSANGPSVTVFAPTNDAFIALLDALGITKQQLFDNRPLLTTVLLYHLVNQEVFAADVLAASEIFPMESEPITVDADALQLNGVNIIATDIDASNGVIHVIDGVLVPPAAGQLLGD